MKVSDFKVIIGLIISVIATGCSSKKEVDFKKYEEITHAAELVLYFDDLTLDTSGASESASIYKYFDGTWDFDYEYEQEDESRFDPLYYSITIESATSNREARQAFGLTKTALNAGNKLFGTVAQEVKNIAMPGDQNFYATLHNEYGQNGFIYVTRHGKKVYSIVFSGIYTEDHYILQEIILPELTNLSSFELLE